MSVLAVAIFWPQTFTRGLSTLTGKDRADVLATSRDFWLKVAAGLGAVTAAILAWGRFELSKEERDLARLSLNADRFSCAVDQLGSDKNDVVLGGLYALEALARSAPTYQSQITEVLSAFVRERVKGRETTTPDGEPTRRVLTVIEQAAVTIVGRNPYWHGQIDLTRADLSGANLAGARLSGADLSGTDFVGADLSAADLRGADLSGANLTGALLVRADLSQAKLTGAKLRAAKLGGAKLNDAELIGVTLIHATLTDADLRGAKLWGGDLTEAVLGDADLTGAGLSDANLTRCDLGPVRPDPLPARYPARKGTKLIDADLTHANLTDANLSEVDFSGATLTDAELNGAHWRQDATPIWPRHFEMPGGATVGWSNDRYAIWLSPTQRPGDGG